MNVLLLNLPNSKRVTRRYMCSYYSEASLFPPVELLALGGICKLVDEVNVKLIDAIDLGIGTEEVIEEIAAFAPTIIVSLIGFECFEEDINEINIIKKHFQNQKIVLFGHYATLFPHEVLKISNADIVIKGEPDLIFQDLIFAIKNNLPTDNIGGLCYKKSKLEILNNEALLRIRKPNELPIPAYDLLPTSNSYEEPMMKKPFAMIQTARGCPYNCNFCVKSYGTRLGLRDEDDVIKELLLLKQKHGIKSFRFIDDTFTVSASRVISICNLIISNNLNLRWSCLSRTDNIKPSILTAMKEAGCKRIYFGIESGSQKMLDYYKKGVDKSEMLKSLLLCREYGIETVGFFMTGLGIETEEDFEESVQFAIDAKLTYAGIAMITPYPGTPLFESIKPELDFTLYPYKVEFKDKKLYEIYQKREAYFYKKFYKRAGFLIDNYHSFLNSIPEFYQQVSGSIKKIRKGKYHLVPKLNYAPEASSISI